MLCKVSERVSECWRFYAILTARVIFTAEYLRGPVCCIGEHQNSFSVTTDKPQRMTNVGDCAYVTQICQWAPSEAMLEVTYGGRG